MSFTRVDRVQLGQPDFELGHFESARSGPDPIRTRKNHDLFAILVTDETTRGICGGTCGVTHGVDLSYVVDARSHIRI